MPDLATDSRSSVLSRLEWRLRTIFSEDPILCEFLDEPYFWSGQGIRGKLCLQVGKIYGLEEDAQLNIAAATEFLHNASLLHDDIIDEDTERRGHPTIWKKYGKEKALLLGDLMIAKSFYLVTQIKTDHETLTRLTQEVSHAVSSAVRGAVRELDFDLQQESQVFHSYHQVCADKTGALFALPVRCIGILAKLSDNELDHLTTIFTNLAVAYQMKDDQADFLGSKIGRSQSSDILNARPNLFHLLLSSGLSESDTSQFVFDQHHSLVSEALSLSSTLPADLKTMLQDLLLPFVGLNSKLSTLAKLSVTG